MLKLRKIFLKLLFEPCILKIVSEQNMGISIMSVHKSKGLEFDHVILLDSLSKNNSNNEDIILNMISIKVGNSILKIKSESLLKSLFILFLKKILQEQIMKMISINFMWLLQELRKV